MAQGPNPSHWYGKETGNEYVLPNFSHLTD